MEPDGQTGKDKRPNAVVLIGGLLVIAILITAVVLNVLDTYKLHDISESNAVTVQTEKATLSKGAETELIVPEGYSARVFASNLGQTRDVNISAGGTVVVSDVGGNRVLALPDKNKDGVADETKEVAKGNRPHGLAFHGAYLFVAELEKVVRYKWDESNLTATHDKDLFSYPNSGHANRTLVVYPDGKLYVSVGSNCNVCLETTQVALTMESDIEGANPRVFTTGNRNASFLAINPKSKELWATENSRDLLGDDIPPDEINILRSGKHYGWPYCYADQVRDKAFNPSTNFNCANTELPAFKIQAHSAPLGLAFINSAQFPTDWQGDLLVAFHGSWNRSEKTGYKVVKLNVEDNVVSGQEDFVTLKNGDVGRPVDMTFDKLGNMYLTDDKTGVVYIIQRL